MTATFRNLAGPFALAAGVLTVVGTTAKVAFNLLPGDDGSRDVKALSLGLLAGSAAFVGANLLLQTRVGISGAVAAIGATALGTALLAVRTERKE